MKKIKKAEGCPLCGAGMLDISEWKKDEWPRNVNPDYPEIPIIGGYYPIYL